MRIFGLRYYLVQILDVLRRTCRMPQSFLQKAALASCFPLRKLGVPYFGVLVIRILLFTVLH